jgi:predicted NACHT family NTPase
MLRTKLILIDGQPGSGKSTTAQFIALQLQKNRVCSKSVDWDIILLFFKRRKHHRISYFKPFYESVKNFQQHGQPNLNTPKRITSKRDGSTKKNPKAYIRFMYGILGA